MQSAYHNLPQINGIDQKDGKEFAAKVLNHKDGRLTLDIAGAYPENAAVKSWKRTVTAEKSAINVTEKYELKEYKAPMQLMFITTVRPQIEKQVVKLGAHRILFNDSQMKASVEDISDKLDPLLQHMWGKNMYRIILSVKSTKTKHQINYSIQ